MKASENRIINRLRDLNQPENEKMMRLLAHKESNGMLIIFGALSEPKANQNTEDIKNIPGESAKLKK